MKFSFRVINTSLRGLEFEADAESVRVGRAPDNDFVLQQRSVSRYHAVLRAENGSVIVQDAGSRNATEIDGEPVGNGTPVESGCIISFGDVAVEVKLPEMEEAPFEMDVEATPPGGAVVPQAEDTPTGEAQGQPAAPETPPEQWPSAEEEVAVEPRPSEKSPAAERLWPAITLVMGVAAAIVLIIYFLNRTLDVPVDERGVSLRVGEAKVIQVPKGFVYNPRIHPPEAVEFDRPLALDIAVQLTGHSEGLATVKVHNKAGKYIHLYCRVLPREREKVLEVFEQELLSDAERRQIARELMRRGEVLYQQGDQYEAMQEYQQAVAVLEPLAQTPPPELRQAEQWRSKIETEVQERYDQLTFEMSNFMKDGDKPMALRRLAEIKELIPNEEDVRWQNADLLYNLLQRVIQREKKKTGRGL